MITKTGKPRHRSAQKKSKERSEAYLKMLDDCGKAREEPKVKYSKMETDEDGFTQPKNTVRGKSIIKNIISS